LQNVASVLRGVCRYPHIDGVREPAARPPVRVEPGEVQNVREAPAVRLTRIVVNSSRRDVAVRTFNCKIDYRLRAYSLEC